VPDTQAPRSLPHLPGILLFALLALAGCSVGVGKLRLGPAKDASPDRALTEDGPPVDATEVSADVAGGENAGDPAADAADAAVRDDGRGEDFATQDTPPSDRGPTAPPMSSRCNPSLP
jgi:hypothetical protein